jgi:hypothetical protein
MTFSPQTLKDLGAFWTKHGGVNLGVVGDKNHCVGYHLGRDEIFSECACKPKGKCIPGLKDKDYSVEEQRDRNGLSNAASALDLGLLDGSKANLQKFGNWLVRQCQANKPGTSDIREIIYSPDGKKVQRYSGVDGLIHTGKGNGDKSHKDHTHISFFRDSENRDKRPIFAPFFEEADMPGLKVAFPETVSGIVTVKDIPGVEARQIADNQAFVLKPGTPKRAFIKGRLLDDPLGKDSPGNDRHSVFVIGDELAVILAEQVDFTPDP